MIISFLGCEKKSDNIDNYLGEIVFLNKEDACFDLIEIKQAPNDGLSIKNRITFNPNDLKEDLEIGDIVRFYTTLCLSPHYIAYAASIELISN